MSPWIECGCIDLDLSKPFEQRYAGISDEVAAKGKRLLRAVMQEIPSRARFLADAVRWRTAGRFHAEVKSLAKLFDVSWREIMIANVSYDLALSTLGCSTMAGPRRAPPLWRGRRTVVRAAAGLSWAYFNSTFQ